MSDPTQTPIAQATVVSTVATPGQPLVHVESAVEISAASVQDFIEREVKLIEKLAAIPFLGAIKALFILACLVCGFVAYEQRDAIIGSLAKSVVRQTEKDHSTALRDAMAQHKTFNLVLGGVRESLGASRALFFQFHNGQNSLKGLPFLFMSESAESLAPGVSNEHDNMQRIPLYVVVDWLPTLLKGQCVSQRYENASASLQLAMRSVGSVAVYACPVNIPGSSEPAGYVSVSYVNGTAVPAFSDAQKRLQEAAAVIGTTLGAYLESR